MFERTAASRVVAATALCMPLITACALDTRGEYQPQKLNTPVSAEEVRNSSFVYQYYTTLNTLPEAIEAENLNTEINYRTPDTSYTFVYNPEQFTPPPQDELDRMYTFIRETTKMGIFSLYAPADSAKYYVGSFGLNKYGAMTAPHMRMVNGIVVDRSHVYGFINLDSGRKFLDTSYDLPLGPFATEFCQAMFVGNAWNQTYQEHVCNAFGIAYAALKADMSYKEYMTLAKTSGRLINNVKVDLEPYSQEKFNLLKKMLFPDEFERIKAAGKRIRSYKQGRISAGVVEESLRRNINTSNLTDRQLEALFKYALTTGAVV